jgi:hypothetical protein
VKASNPVSRPAGQTALEDCADGTPPCHEDAVVLGVAAQDATPPCPAASRRGRRDRGRIRGRMKLHDPEEGFRSGQG